MSYSTICENGGRRRYISSSYFWPWLTRESPQQLAISLINLVTMTCIIQAEDDHWAGDYGGPMFLLGLVISVYVTGALNTVLPEIVGVCI